MNTTTSQPITTQLQSFAYFALVIIALGSFQQTHMVAVFILAFVALVLIIRLAGALPQ